MFCSGTISCDAASFAAARAIASNDAFGFNRSMIVALGRCSASRSRNAAWRRGRLAVTVAWATPSMAWIAATTCARDAASSFHAFVSASSIRLRPPPTLGVSEVNRPASLMAECARLTLPRSTWKELPSPGIQAMPAFCRACCTALMSSALRAV